MSLNPHNYDTLKDIQTLDMFEAAAIDKTRKRTFTLANEGCLCPVCDQNVRVYKRMVTANMAAQLIRSFSRFGAGVFFHISTFDKTVTDWAVLAHFHLIEAHDHEAGEQGKRTSGYWRITPHGENFVRGIEPVQEYAIIYNKKLIAHEGAPVFIREALGVKFNYDHLMSR